jgi:hypothetical protein
MDDFSNHLYTMIREMRDLKSFVLASRNRVFESDDANQMVEAATEYYRALRETVRSLTTGRGYARYLESFDPKIDETNIDAEALKEKFVIRTFNEKFEAALPHIAKAYQKKIQEQNALYGAAQNYIDGETKFGLTESDVELYKSMKFESGQALSKKVLEHIATLLQGTDSRLSEFAAQSAEKFSTITEAPESQTWLHQDLAMNLVKGFVAEMNNLSEKALNPYAIGMAQAMNEPPLKKSTIKKAHHIADKIADKEQGMAEDSGQELTVQQLATISDEALDNAYGYGRSSPGNSFGWQANLMSAEYAKKMIDAGVTDIEQIADAIHKGWNVTAHKFVQNPDQFDDTEKLRAAGKLDAKLQQRAKLMKINYAQLDNEEQEKDRVVARALLQVLKGQQGMAEGSITSNVTVNKVHDDGHEKEWHVFRGKEMIGYVIKNQPDFADGLYIAYGHGPGRAFVEEFTGLKPAVNYITSLKEGVAEGAPELLKKEMPLHRHAEKLLAQNGVSKDDPDYHHHLGNTIKHLRQFGNIDLINKSDEQGVAEGLPQILRKVVPGYAKREIDKKMDAQKFGRTDVDRDANYYRYKKIQDKLKEQGVAEGSNAAKYYIVNHDTNENIDGPFDTREEAETVYDRMIKRVESGTMEKNFKIQKKKGVAEGNDKNVVVKFSASEYAAMSPEQKAAKQQEWQTLKQQAKKQLKNFTLVDTDKEQGVAEEVMVEISSNTLKSYQQNVSNDAMKHKMDPTKRSPEKANRSISGFSKAQKRLEKGLAEGSSDISGLMAASHLNKSFIITAETAEGQTKRFRVNAQSERVAKEKFEKHHSMAKIVSIKEEGMAENIEGHQDELEKNLRYSGSRSSVADVIRQKLNPNSAPELFGLKVGDVVKARVDDQIVQGNVIDLFPETMEVELLLRGDMAGRTVTVDVRDTEYMDESGVAEERKVTKNEKGDVTGWSDETPWQKANPNKQKSGKAANLAGKALKQTQKMADEEPKISESKATINDKMFTDTLAMLKKYSGI